MNSRATEMKEIGNSDYTILSRAFSTEQGKLRWCMNKLDHEVYSISSGRKIRTLICTVAKLSLYSEWNVSVKEKSVMTD
jgi:hypothetical protein